jgi:hypothetical protein
VQTKLQPTSFVSSSGKYIYHFGLMDYSQKYQSLGFFKKKKAKDVETYKNSFKKMVYNNLLVSRKDDG